MSSKKSAYCPRVADILLADSLRTSGATQIVGPKWCGKTTTAEQVAKEIIYFQDPDMRESYLQIAQEKPSVLLRGKKPLLLDEWQDAPSIWDAVRFAVDKEEATGSYILTGSSVPKETDKVKHSGTGRFSRIKMRPMSLYESRESNGSIALGDLFDQKDISAKTDLALEDVAHALVRGGWPASVVLNDNYAAQRVRDYVESIIESDISRVDGVDKNPKRVRLLMRSLARNESTPATMTTIRRDMAGTDEGLLSTNTIATYLNALRKLYVIDETEAWAQAVRSKTALRTSPVRRYCDPSIPAALLRLSPDKLLADFNTFGLLFETLCVRDLAIYAEAIDGSVGFYRDSRGLECDAIVELADGRWGAIEIKLMQSRAEEAAATLTKIRQEVRSSHGGEPTFLAILTTGSIGYCRSDGIYVIPIGCLKH